MRPLSRSLTLVVLTLALFAGRSTSLIAQTTQKPPVQAKPTQKPTPPPAKPAAEAPKPPVAAPAPQDLKYAATYTADGLQTASSTFIKGQRERFEFQDIVLLKQHDLKRTVQIMKSANTYLVVADGAPLTPMVPGAPAAPPRPPGVVNVTTTIVDTGERKTVFGQQARHVKMMIDRQPMQGACDPARQRIETDGWYIDQPKALANQPVPTAPNDAAAGGCNDQIQSTVNGDGKALGFPISYTTTITGQDGKSVATSMEVTALELTTLDPSLFEIPAGMNAAMNMGEMAKMLSDINETKLAEADKAAAPAAKPKATKPGAARVGVPEFTNKTTQTVNTRAMRQELIAQLAEEGLEGVPMAAASPEEVQKRAAQLGYDFVLFGEVTELKTSKPNALGGIMKVASGVAGGGAPAGGSQEIVESTIAIKLVQTDGKPRLATTAKGKEGGFTLKDGLSIAKFAGGMYLSMYGGSGIFQSLSSYGAANLGGMSMLGNPMLAQMQTGVLGGLGKGAGIDATAGAASYLLQQGMAMNKMGGLGGTPGSGPSFDASLSKASENAAKAVAKAVTVKK
jgi:hypothetical protein